MQAANIKREVESTNKELLVQDFLQALRDDSPGRREFTEAVFAHVAGPAEAISDYLTGMQRVQSWLFQEELQNSRGR